MAELPQVLHNGHEPRNLHAARRRCRARCRQGQWASAEMRSQLAGSRLQMQVAMLGILSNRSPQPKQKVVS